MFVFHDEFSTHFKPLPDYHLKRTNYDPTAFGEYNRSFRQKSSLPSSKTEEDLIAAIYSHRGMNKSILLNLLTSGGFPRGLSSNSSSK